MSTDYTEVTNFIRVSVRAFFMPDRSNPDESQFFWAYRVRIENLGDTPVQLLRRTWSITDAAGRTQLVHGEGVIGQTPLIEPGGSFEYTSGTPLTTASGFMRGQYHMIEPATFRAFDVTIPAFSLDSPHQPGRVH